MFSLPRILPSITVITRRSAHSPCQVLRHDISCASAQLPAGFRKQAQFFVLLVLCLAYVYTHTKHSCQPVPCKATAGPTSSSPQMWAHDAGLVVAQAHPQAAPMALTPCCWLGQWDRLWLPSTVWPP